ncbi:MAG: 4Fe-4S binding protein [Rikenella sp.]|nr:4Fe-4S binding protein [Rikenella sp.]
MKIDAIVFSPTRTGRRVVERVAAGFAAGSDRIEWTDLTPWSADTTTGERVVGGVAVVAVPVYGGRVAERAVERLARIRAAEPGRTPAILVVVYGNRDYEDALLELGDWAVGQGFVPLAGGAFVGEHSYSRPKEGMPIAEGRPDEADCAAAERFGAEARAKYERLKAGAASPDGGLVLPGRRPYKVKGAATPATPTTDPERCTGCGVCVGNCPTGAIGLTPDGVAASGAERCIKCCACLKFCPAGARSFVTPYTERLFRNFTVRREPELFL